MRVVKNIFYKSTDKVEDEDMYEVVSVDEQQSNSEVIYVKMRVRGKRSIFSRPVSELYTKKWIDGFSKEDAAYIAVLFSAQRSNNLEIIRYFPRKQKLVTKNVIFLAMIFVTFLIVSNLTAFKVVEFNTSKFLFLKGIFNNFDINFPAALVFFPLTYFFDDTLTEVYGFKTSRFVIWGGLFCNTVFTLSALLTVYLPPSHFWHYQSQYSVIFTSAPRVFVASTIGYFCGEFLNSIILSKMKIIMKGKRLWLRLLASTATGVSIDSIIFCHVAFIGSIPGKIIWEMVFVQICFKVCYEALAIPFSYKIISYLKGKDHIDYYDFSTRYNPFSLKIEE